MKQITFALAILISTPLQAMNSFPQPMDPVLNDDYSLFSLKGASIVASSFGVGTLTGLAGSQVLPNKISDQEFPLGLAKVAGAFALIYCTFEELNSEQPFKNPLVLTQVTSFIIGVSVGKLLGDRYLS